MKEKVIERSQKLFPTRVEQWGDSTLISKAPKITNTPAEEGICQSCFRAAPTRTATVGSPCCGVFYTKESRKVPLRTIPPTRSYPACNYKPPPPSSASFNLVTTGRPEGDRDQESCSHEEHVAGTPIDDGRQSIRIHHRPGIDVSSGSSTADANLSFPSYQCLYNRRNRPE